MFIREFFLIYEKFNFRGQRYMKVLYFLVYGFYGDLVIWSISIVLFSLQYWIVVCFVQNRRFYKGIDIMYYQYDFSEIQKLCYEKLIVILFINQYYYREYLKLQQIVQQLRLGNSNFQKFIKLKFVQIIVGCVIVDYVKLWRRK